MSGQDAPGWMMLVTEAAWKIVGLVRSEVEGWLGWLGWERAARGACVRRRVRVCVCVGVWVCYCASVLCGCGCGWV
jgi:hypothetical protein